MGLMGLMALIAYHMVNEIRQSKGEESRNLLLPMLRLASMREDDDVDRSVGLKVRSSVGRRCADAVKKPVESKNVIKIQVVRGRCDD